MVIKKEEGDREIRLIAGRDRLKESTQELVRSFKDICENKEKFDELVDDLLAKSNQYMLYSSQKEQLKRVCQLEKNTLKMENSMVLLTFCLIITNCCIQN